jgi:hypothetical protein
MPRTIIKTNANGWFLDAADPDGNRVRKQEGDVVLTREQFEALKNGDTSVLPNTGNAAVTPEQEAERQETVKNGAAASKPAKPAKTPAPRSTLSSGKEAVGKTATIKCAWVDPDKRTPAQQKLFAGPTREITYDKVTKAAKGDQNAMPCGAERTIKVQDVFQVRFCTEHTDARRNEMRRLTNQKRAAERKAAKTAA